MSSTQKRVQYAIDGVGNRRKTETSDLDALSQLNGFDAAGNMTLNTDFRQVSTTYKYDALNRLKSMTAPSAVSIALTYDTGVNGVGHLTGAVDESGTTALSYTTSGRLAQSVRTVGTLAITTKYKYDEVGRLRELTYPSGRVLTYEYLKDKLVKISHGATVVMSDIAYHPFGPPTNWTWGNGKGYAKHYNLNGELEKYDDANSVKTIVRDEAGRIRAIKDSLSTGHNQSFDYDDLDHLSKYRVGQPAVLEREFAYDSEGNRTGLKIAGQQFTYTHAEGTNFLADVSGPVERHWRPADDLAKTLTDGTNVFGLDPYRRTNSVSNAKATVRYLRDFSSRRVSKKFYNGATIHYVYDLNGQLIAELDGSGATLVEYVSLGDAPVAVVQQGAVNYVYSDHLNTPRSITDLANVLRWTWHSEPFGSTPANSNPSGKGPFIYNPRFPGQYFDAESGFHYNYYRDYDPQTGRYIQSDPIGLGGGINTYSYVDGNPLSSIDPSGLAKCIPQNVQDGLAGPAGAGVSTALSTKNGYAIAGMTSLGFIAGYYGGGEAGGAFMGVVTGGMSNIQAGFNMPAAITGAFLGFVAGVDNTAGGGLVTGILSGYHSQPTGSYPTYGVFGKGTVYAKGGAIGLAGGLASDGVNGLINGINKSCTCK